MTVTIEPEHIVTTPTVRGGLRRIRFWIAAAVLVLLTVVGYNLVSPPSLTALPLAANGTGETGSQALVRVLQQHGISVAVTSSLSATRAAVHAADRTTILVYDPSGYLDAGQRTTLTGLAAQVIVIAPSASALRNFAPGVSPAATSRSTLAAHCSLPAARNAGTIADSGHAYRVSADAENAMTCFPSGAHAYSLVRIATATGSVTVVGATNAFTNEFIADRGNAALAVNLLGATPRLVWYLPSIEDIQAAGRGESLTQAAPGWIEPLSILLLLVVVAAGVWRGRRFGPLVVERMPVIVRASETMEGRARLYQSSSARLRSLDALRIGAIERITRVSGLARTASVDDVIAAVAAATRRDLQTVRALLVDEVPQSDAALVRLSDDLLQLERDVAAAARPS
jgi:hypothetical protein